MLYGENWPECPEGCGCRDCVDDVLTADEAALLDDYENDGICGLPAQALWQGLARVIPDEVVQP